MFNLKPKLFFQQLQNKLHIIIWKTGQFFGIFTFQVPPDAQIFTYESKPLLIWAIIASFLQISTIAYLVYYFYFFLERNIPDSNVISSALMTLGNVISFLCVFVRCFYVVFRRKLVLTIVNRGAELQSFLCQLDHDEIFERFLVYLLAIKLLLDYTVILGTLFLFIYELVSTLEWLRLISLVEPVLLLIYTFTMTIFYICFAYGLCLMRRLNVSLNADNCNHRFFYCHQEILKFLRKANQLMECVMFLSVFGAFISLVGEVNLLICYNQLVVKVFFFKSIVH